MIVVRSMARSSNIPLNVFVHIPDTRLSKGVEIPYAGGVLRVLKYEEWAEIDREISEKRQRSFESMEPSFYVRLNAATYEERVSDDGNPSDAASIYATMEAKQARWDAVAVPALEAGIEAANELWLALTLMSSAPTRSIEESISYVSDGKNTSRTVGRLERRAILDNRPELFLSKNDVEKIASILAMVTSAKPATRLGEFAQALATLGSTALPDFEPIDGLMHSAIALEAILLSDVTSGVTAAFVERGAGLLASEPSEIAPLRAMLQTIYTLRSDALHGRDSAQAPQAGAQALVLWRWTRRALARAMIRILYVSRNAADCPTRLVELRAELETARATLTIPAMLIGAPAGSPL